MKLTRLTHRSEFLAAAKAPYRAHGAVVVQARARDDGDAAVKVGFTATKKVGGAVERNRAKRRLRAAARALLPELGHPGHDYVLIARPHSPDKPGTTNRPWQGLLDDVRRALIRLSPK